MTCQYPGCSADEADEDIVCTDHRQVADEARARGSRVARAGRVARAAAGRTESAEPACWSWELPSKTEEEVRAELASGTGDRRLSPSTIDRMLSDWPAYRFEDFHAGRCAICGLHVGDAQAVDHDHETGMVRGLLCRGCNTAEGMSSAPVYAMYRRKNPASIIGLVSPYYLWSGMDVVNDPPCDPWRENPMVGVGL